MHARVKHKIGPHGLFYSYRCPYNECTDILGACIHQFAYELYTKEGHCVFLVNEEDGVRSTAIQAHQCFGECDKEKEERAPEYKNKERRFHRPRGFALMNLTDSSCIYKESAYGKEDKVFSHRCRGECSKHKDSHLLFEETLLTSVDPREARVREFVIQGANGSKLKNAKEYVMAHSSC